MRIAICTDAPSAGRLAAAVALARSAADPDSLVVLRHGRAAPPGDGPPTGPVVRVSECYTRDGAFQPIRLIQRVDAIPAAELKVVVLDSSVGPMVTIDALGNRTGEVPYYFMRRFFWEGPRPEVVVHFVLPHLLMYYVRDWTRLIQYPPLETNRSTSHDDATNRIAAIVRDATNLRSHYHPWDKFKRRVKDRLRSWASWKP